MREILFRGKSVKSGAWTIGYYCHYFDIVDKGKDDADYIIIGAKETIMFPFIEVDPNTIGQYTGLCDKNGTKIFEGDIIESHYDDMYPDNATFEEVVFSGGAWRLAQNGYDDSDPLCEDDISGYGVVVGNIYDNPELLKGGAE